MPAERPVLTNDYCPACARVVWNLEVLQHEEKHRLMHERNECHCSTNFSLQRDYRLHSECGTRPQAGSGKGKGRQGNRSAAEGVHSKKPPAPKHPSYREGAKGDSMADEGTDIESSKEEQTGSNDYVGFRLAQDQPVVYAQGLAEASQYAQAHAIWTSGAQAGSYPPKPEAEAENNQYGDCKAPDPSPTAWQLQTLDLQVSPFPYTASTSIAAAHESVVNVAGGMRFYPQTQEQGYFTGSRTHEQHKTDVTLQPDRLGFQAADKDLSQSTWSAAENVTEHNLQGKKYTLAQLQKSASQSGNGKGSVSSGRNGGRRGTAITSVGFPRNKSISWNASSRSAHIQDRLFEEPTKNHEHRTGDVDNVSLEDTDRWGHEGEHAQIGSSEGLRHILSSNAELHGNRSKVHSRNSPLLRQRPDSA